MRRLIFPLILFLLITFAPVEKAFSYWIWTPSTGKWVNPKYAPKSTPKEQLEYSLSFYKEKKYSDAERELKSLLKYYPKAAEAAEAQYYLGIVYEAEDKDYEAYQAYQKVVDKYPFSERIQEINEREFKIAEKFMSGEKRKFAGMPLPVDNPSIEIFSKIVSNSQYGPLAPVAQYKLGLVLMGLARYSEADEAFEKVISNYPTSEWAEAAKYQLAATQAKQSQGPEYDQVSMQEAKNKFEQFVKEHPDASLSKEAEKNISELKNKEAEANYNIAVFYEKQKAYAAAKDYCQLVVDNYSETPWAKQAEAKIKEIDVRLEGNKKIDKKVLKEIKKEKNLSARQDKLTVKQSKLEEKKRLKAEKTTQKLAEKQAKKDARAQKAAEKLAKKEQDKQAKIEKIRSAKETKAKQKEAKTLATLDKKTLKQAKIDAAKQTKQAKIEATRQAKQAKAEAAKQKKAAKLEEKKIAREEKIRKAKEARERKLREAAEKKQKKIEAKRAKEEAQRLEKERRLLEKAAVK
ncbi:MAG: outer membrane protein assembly factor BamD [Candidatus Omnitrophica bacterium]|nr:outer membrane protein assembly factor BamD [Candidatus Omnitrophota bacterium]